SGFEINQYVYVAIGSKIVPNDRTEQRELTNAPFAAKGFQSGQIDWNWKLPHLTPWLRGLYPEWEISCTLVVPKRVARYPGRGRFFACCIRVAARISQVTHKRWPHRSECTVPRD